MLYSGVSMIRPIRALVDYPSHVMFWRVLMTQLIWALVDNSSNAMLWGLTTQPIWAMVDTHPILLKGSTIRPIWALVDHPFYTNLKVNDLAHLGSGRSPILYFTRESRRPSLFRPWLITHPILYLKGWRLSLFGPLEYNITCYISECWWPSLFERWLITHPMLCFKDWLPNLFRPWSIPILYYSKDRRFDLFGT